MWTDEDLQRSHRDAAVDAAVSMCGWLAAVVWGLGCIRGWWWGGDLRNIPLFGESAAQAADARRGWPWVPGLVMVTGGLMVRQVWCRGAHRLRGAGPVRRRTRRPRRVRRPLAGAC